MSQGPQWLNHKPVPLEARELTLWMASRTSSVCCFWEQQELLVALSLAHVGEHLEGDFYLVTVGKGKRREWDRDATSFSFSCWKPQVSFASLEPELLWTKWKISREQRLRGDVFKKRIHCCIPSMSLLPSPPLPEHSPFFVLSGPGSIIFPSCYLKRHSEPYYRHCLPGHGKARPLRN